MEAGSGSGVRLCEVAMESRGEVRYDLLVAVQRKSLDADSFFLELELRDSVRAIPVDISLRGLGFEIRGFDAALPQYYETQRDFIVKLHFDGDSIVAGVKTAWHRLFAEGKGMILRGGVQIDLISPEDRLKLSAIVERIRSSQME